MCCHDQGNIVSICSINVKREDQIEKWLREQVIEIYGDEDDADNPMLRLSVIFDALSFASQQELYEYAKKFAYRNSQSLRNEFWDVLRKVPAAWEDIEVFAGTLLVKEKTYKQSGKGH